MLFNPTSADVHVGMIIYLAGLVLLPSRRASSFALATVAIYAAVSACSAAQFASTGSLAVLMRNFGTPLLWPALSFGVSKFRKVRWSSRFVWNEKAPNFLHEHAATPRAVM